MATHLDVDGVSELVSETTQLVGTVDGLIVIRRERVWSDGTRLGGELRCRRNLQLGQNTRMGTRLPKFPSNSPSRSATMGRERSGLQPWT